MTNLQFVVPPLAQKWCLIASSKEVSLSGKEVPVLELSSTPERRCSCALIGLVRNHVRASERIWFGSLGETPTVLFTSLKNPMKSSTL